jgi:hypothetical protein
MMAELRKWLIPFVASFCANFEGEHQMRGENIEFTLRVKIIPYSGP